MLKKVTDLYHLSIKRTEGEGDGIRPSPMTTKVKNTPRQVGLSSHDNEKYDRFRTELVEFAWFIECNCLMSSLLFTSFYDVCLP